MPFTVVDLGLGLALPAAVTLAVFAVLLQMSRRLRAHQEGDSRSDSWEAPLALCVGFGTGYRALALGPISPDSHWHWLPYVVAAASIAGLFLPVFVRSRVWRGLLFFVASIAAAMLLVPTWNDLEPPRAVYLIVWPLFVTGITLSIERSFSMLSDRGSAVYSVMLVVTFSSSSALLVLADNLRFSHMSMTLLGGSIGLLFSALLFRDLHSWRLTAFPVAVAVCGLMLIGRVHTFSSIPLVSWLLIPVAPCALWIGAIPATDPVTPFRRAAVSVGLSLAACAAAVGLALWAVREVFE